MSAVFRLLRYSSHPVLSSADRRRIREAQSDARRGELGRFATVAVPRTLCPAVSMTGRPCVNSPGASGLCRVHDGSRVAGDSAW